MRASVTRRSREARLSSQASISPIRDIVLASGPDTAGEESSIRDSENLSELAHRTVKDLILSRTLKGGDVIIEGRLAEALKISRTPLREALVRLEGEGLLVKQASRCFAVRKVNASEFFQAMKVREILEGEAIALGAVQIAPRDLQRMKRRIQELSRIAEQTREHWEIDDEVHETIAAASGNAILVKMVRELRMTTRLFEVARPFNRTKEDATEHLAILDACEKKDGRLARRAIEMHLSNLQRQVLGVLSGR